MTSTSATRYQGFIDEPDTFLEPDQHQGFFGAHMARYQFAAALAAGKQVLDVGCGSGYGTATLAGVARGAFGIDASRRALTIAAAAGRPRGARFALMDARATALRSEAFDLATCFEVIEHVDASVVDDILSEVVRCLKRDGVALFSTPNHAVVTKAGAHVPEFHINNLSEEQFRVLLRRHFGRVQMWGQRLTGNPVYRAVRTLDVLGLRYTAYNLLGRRSQQRAYAAMGVEATRPHAPEDFEFSRWFVSRAGMLLAVCRK